MDARSGASADAAGGASAGAAASAPNGVRRALAADFAACRAATLALFRRIDPALFRRQLHAEFSPLGWHLGHIAYTEALWLLGGGATPPALARAFAVDGLSKAERTGIPDAAETAGFLAAVRIETLKRLADSATPLDERLWRFVLQHEAQHAETATFLHALATAEPGAAVAPDRRAIDFVRVPGGTATIGSNDPAALDNERPAHGVAVAPFRLARYPVTEAAFAAFMADGGYRRAELWSEAGWAWRRHAGIERPQHWRGRGDHPVCGVSAHEAEAYCRWAGARLPNEFEWEHAARGAVVTPGAVNFGGAHGGTTEAGRGGAAFSGDGISDLLGNAWEWTSSAFAPYPGFRPWPYAGYSEAWFDGRHRVLRGGSWATRGCALRPSFRNWYHPETRQIFAGFRCAADDT